MKRIEVRMSDELHELIRKISYETRQSMNQIIVNAIRTGLDEKK